MVRSILLVWNRLDQELDTWSCFLNLLGLWFFFGFILGVAWVYIGLLYGGAYGYCYGALWISVFSLLAYREVKRRMKAQLGETNYYNPNATKEYLELPSVKNKRSERA
jgi:hypothetical protein